MMVALTYFKQTGKYYSEGNYQSSYEHAFEVYKEVREMMDNRTLPDLAEGHSDFIVLVQPSMSAPAILVP